MRGREEELGWLSGRDDQNRASKDDTLFTRDRARGIPRAAEVESSWGLETLCGLFRQVNGCLYA
jgi:hypothetical protein